MPRLRNIALATSVATSLVGGAIVASPAAAWTTVQSAKTICVYDANGKASGQVTLSAGNREKQPAYGPTHNMTVEALLDGKSQGSRLAAVGGKDAMWMVSVSSTYRGGTAKFVLRWADGRSGVDTKMVSVPAVPSGCVDKTKPPTTVPTVTATPATPVVPPPTVVMNPPPTVTVEQPAVANFVVRKDANKKSTRKGGKVIFTVVVKNTGGVTLKLRLSDVMPSGMVLSGKLPSGTSLKNGRLTANVSLAPGASKRFVYQTTTVRSGKLCNVVAVAGVGLTRRDDACVVVRVPTKVIQPTPVAG